MRPLSVQELLTLWEGGLNARPFERAFAILSIASPESSREELARISIGRRDSCLLQLREWAFGSDLSILASCPHCGQALEMMMPVSNLRACSEPIGDLETSLALRDYEVQCRPPNTEDLIACAGPEISTAREKLFARCVTDARYRGQPVSTNQLPDDIARQVVEKIDSIDPQADTRIMLSCPDCHHGWDEVFDVVSFFWTEIDFWARRIFKEVHILAAAYGWRESDILALSPSAVKST